jgi:hypothetical protein
VVTTGLAGKRRSGLVAPAYLIVGLGLAASLPGQGIAQRPRPAQPQPALTAPQPIVPDPLIVKKLIWSTMAAVDHANSTGNYSVLRDLAAPSFQSNNNAATLASVFQSIRVQRVDLSNTLLVAPTYEIAPVIQNGLLRVRGTFPLRPAGIGFDLFISPSKGRWALFGIASGTDRKRNYRTRAAPLKLGAGRSGQLRHLAPDNQTDSSVTAPRAPLRRRGAVNARQSRSAPYGSSGQ